jgi:hypothetical protein
MFKNLRKEWRESPVFYGIVFFPILGLFGLFAYEAIYMLALEIWCIAYGLVY